MMAPKILLFPFSIETHYFESYAWAVELAHRMNARLQLFTTALSPIDPQATQSIYHSLLQAHGYYLEHYRTKPGQEVVGEPLISTGEMGPQLVSHLKNHPVDIVILDPVFSSHYVPGLPAMIPDMTGVIQLPSEVSRNPAGSASDRFYDHLRKARLYKLPNNFFATLGKDRTAFNYLRKFFQKHLP